MDIRKNTYIIEKVATDIKLIDNTIIKFRNHPCALKIKEKVNNLDNRFSFEETEKNELIKEIHSLNPKRTGTRNDIPGKFLETTRTHVLHF